MSFTTPAADLEAIVYNASISACAKADRTEALSLLAELLEETLWRSPELQGRRDNTMLGRTVLVSVTLYCGLAFWLHQLPTLNLFQISPFTNLSRQDQTFRHHDMCGQLSRLEYHGASNVVSYSAAMPAAWLRYPSRKVGYCISCYIILYIHDHPLLSMNDYPLLSIVIHYYPLLPQKLSTSFHDYPFISPVLPIIFRWMNLMSSWSMCSQSFRRNYENKAISFAPGLPCGAVHLRLVLKCGLPVYSNLW